MKTECRVGKWDDMWNCNLKCDNGNTNKWSVRHLQVQTFPNECNKGVPPWARGSEERELDDRCVEWFKWKPRKIKNVETLCDKDYKQLDCYDIEERYNVSDESLSWNHKMLYSNSVAGRKDTYNFV